MSEKLRFKRWSLWLMLSSIGAPLLSLGLFFGFYLQGELEERRSALFFQLEQWGQRMDRQLEQEYRWNTVSQDNQTLLQFQTEPRAILAQASTSPLFGTLSPEEMQALRSEAGGSSSLQLYRVAGKLLLVREQFLSQPTLFLDKNLAPGPYTLVWELSESRFAFDLPKDFLSLFYLNKLGHIVYANPSVVNAEELWKKPIVQESIKSPLQKSLTPIRVTQKGMSFGFMMYLPLSQLNFFAELSPSRLFTPLLPLLSLCAGILLACLAVSLMIWRSLMAEMQTNVAGLSHALDEFAKGYLIPTHLQEGAYLKELGPLVQSINKNTRGVRERVDLMEKQKK